MALGCTAGRSSTGSRNGGSAVPKRVLGSRYRELKWEEYMRIAGLTIVPILALTLVCAGQAWADGDGQTPAQPSPPARYAFNRVNDGFLRLDNVTGNVAYCGQTTAGWACQAVPEDRAALEKEIARLQDEVASLKQEVAAFRDPVPPRPPAELSKPDSAPPSMNNDKSAELRSDMKRAGAALKNAWDSLVDMISNFQKDMLRKG
jgi:hypothetical protein